MKRLWIVLWLCWAAGLPAAEAANPAPRLLQRIALPGVEGPLGPLAFDARGLRVFIAAAGNESVEVVDLGQGRRTHSLPIPAVRAVLFLPEPPRLLVAGANGLFTALHAGTFEPRGTLDFQRPAGPLLYHPEGGQIYVAYGAALGRLSTNLHFLGATTLPGVPAALQRSADGQRLYAGLPRQIARLDPAQGAVRETWPLPQLFGDYSLQLDEPAGLMLVGSREPPHLIALDLKTGQETFRLALDADVGDLALNPEQHLLFAACGSGFLDVFERAESGGGYQLAHRVKTAPGAKAVLLIPEWRLLFLAVPAQAGQPAELRIYSVNRGRPALAGLKPAARQ